MPKGGFIAEVISNYVYRVQRSLEPMRVLIDRERFGYKGFKMSPYHHPSVVSTSGCAAIAAQQILAKAHFSLKSWRHFLSPWLRSRELHLSSTVPYISSSKNIYDHV